MAREEDGDGRIVHEVEYDGYSGRRWWHMLDDERWRAVPEQAGAGAGGTATDGDGDAAMDRADGEQGAHLDRLWCMEDPSPDDAGQTTVRRSSRSRAGRDEGGSRWTLRRSAGGCTERLGAEQQGPARDHVEDG